MPRFYLHQRSENADVEDHVGVEYPSLEAAVIDAIGSARELMADCGKDGMLPPNRHFEIADARGVILASVPFIETLSEDESVDDRKRCWVRIDAF